MTRLHALLLFSFMASSSVSITSADEILWLNGIEEAKRIAGQSQRLVLVHFWSNSCRPCAKLEQEVYNQPGIGQHLAIAFVPVKVNVDEYPAVRKQYNINSVPADVILSPDGRILENRSCPLSVSEYMAGLAKVAATHGPSAAGAYAGLAAGVPAAMQTITAQTVSHNVVTSVAEAGQVGDRYASYFSAPAAAADAGATPTYPPANLPPSQTASNYAQPLNPAAAPAATGGIGLPTPQLPTAAPFGAAPATAGPGPNPGGDRYTGQVPSPSGLAAAPFQQGTPPRAEPQLPSAPWPGAASATPPGPPQSRPIQRANATVEFPIQQPAMAGPSANDPALQGPLAGGPAAVPPGAAGPASPLGPAAPNSGEPPLALDGTCPVELVKNEHWVAGDRRFGAVHRGRLYLFAGPEQQQEFLRNPDGFMPVLSGNDPVLALDQQRVAAGRREHGVFYGNRVFLFASEETLGQFYRDPTRYAEGVRQAELNGRLIRR